MRLADDPVLELDLLLEARNLVSGSLVDHVMEIGQDGIGDEFPLPFRQLRGSLILLARCSSPNLGILLFMIRLNDWLWHWLVFSEFTNDSLGYRIICGLVFGFLFLLVGFDFCHGLVWVLAGSPDLVIEGMEALLAGCGIGPLCLIPEWLDILQDVNDGVANLPVVLGRLAGDWLLRKELKHRCVRLVVLLAIWE